THSRIGCAFGSRSRAGQAQALALGARQLQLIAALLYTLAPVVEPLRERLGHRPRRLLGQWNRRELHRHLVRRDALASLRLLEREVGLSDRRFHEPDVELGGVALLRTQRGDAQLLAQHRQLSLPLSRLRFLAQPTE